MKGRYLVGFMFMAGCNDSSRRLLVTYGIFLRLLRPAIQVADIALDLND